MESGGAKEGYQIRGTKVWSKYPVQLTPAERRLIFSLEKLVEPEMLLADVYLPKAKKRPEWERGDVVTEADLVQVDCIAVTAAGVLVFESKDYVGWIYGHGERVYWTQVSAYGQNKHQFYNPIRQNAGHVAAVRAIVGAEVPIFSLVVFGRETTLKVLENIEDGCYVLTQANLRSVVKRLLEKECLSVLERQVLRQKLDAGRIEPGIIVREEHIKEIVERKRS